MNTTIAASEKKLALPILEGLEPKLDASNKIHGTDGRLPVRKLIGVVLLRASPRMERKRHQEQGTKQQA